MPSDEVSKEILLNIPDAGQMTDDELAQALLGIGETTRKPTVSLYVAPSTATRMAPCPVHAAIDFGEIEKSIRNGTYTWETVNSGTTINPQVNADNLDGDETADDTTAQTFTGNDHVDINSTSVSSTRTNGLFVFPSVTIPTGKAIVSANLRLWANTVSNARMSIYGEDVDSAADLSTTADINGRTLTTANVAWNDTSLAAGQYHNSPDISTVVQELYDRQGEFSSANIGIICQATNTGGTQLFRAASYFDNGLTESAILTIEYADAPLSSEYKLSSHTVAQLTRSGDTPSNIVVNENGSPMSEGTVGSLAAGEWGQSGGELYVRLTDSADPESKADDYLDISFDVSTTGDSSEWQDCRIMWQASSGAVASGYSTVTDPRPGLGSKSIDVAGRTNTSNYNRPRGFNMSWVFGQGSHTISATVTNPSGESTTETSGSITIAANSRTSSTVGSGKDYADLDAAEAALGATSDIELVLDNGGSETFTATELATTFSGSNVWIHLSDSAGARHTIDYDGTDSDGSMLTFSGENFLVEGLNLTESSGFVESAAQELIGINPQNSGAFVNCKASGDVTNRLNHFFSPSAALDGLLILNCESDYTRGYSWTATSGLNNLWNISLIGCTFGPSTNESTVRTVGNPEHFNVLWCDLSNDTSKSALRIAGRRYIHAYGCKFTDGDNWVGAPSITAEVSYARVECCYSSGATSAAARLGGVTQAVEYFTLANCIGEDDEDMALTVGNGAEAYDNAYKRFIKLLHNTMHATDTVTTTFVTGGTTNGQSEHASNRVAANLFVHGDSADLTGYLVAIGDDVADFDQNVWPATHVNLTGFAQVYVGTTPNRTDTALSNWNAETWVGTDTETDVTLDADFIPSSPQTVTTEPGAFDDYYGNARDSTSYAGAVIAANPAPPDPTPSESEDKTYSLTYPLTYSLTYPLAQ